MGSLTTHRLVALSVVLLFAGCGKGSEDKASKGEVAATNMQTPAKPQSAKPCEILTEAIIRKHFKIPDDIKVEQKSSELSRHPHCGYNWNTLTPEEEIAIRTKLRDEAVARIKNKSKDKGPAQKIGDLAYRRNYGQGSAHLTMTKEMASEDAAVSALGSARSFIEDRAKVKAGEDTVDLTSSTSDVAGVGNKAYYSEKQRQISVAYGKRLYHLGATPDREGDSLELATAIAKEIFP